MRKKNKLLISILKIRLDVRFHNGNFPDHKNNICKVVLYLFKFQK